MTSHYVRTAEPALAPLPEQSRTQARSRPWASTSAARRSRLRWIPNWLRPRRSRMIGGPLRSAKGRPVVLRDGSKVLIRQVQRTDAPLLADGFTRLSAHSRRMRFLGRKDSLSAADLRYLTDVDHHDHEALGALDQADGRGVGIARYVRDAEDPQAAEIALTIVDDWQGRGLGTELLARLSDRGRQEGIRRFIAVVAYDNAAVAGLLRNVGADLVRREPGTAEYEISLAPGGEHDHADRSVRPQRPPSRLRSRTSSPGRSSGDPRADGRARW